MFKKIALIIAVSVLAALSTTAHAAFTFTVTQVGNNVVVNGSGSLITTALANIDTYFGNPQLAPRNGLLLSGASANYQEYFGITGPNNFSGLSGLFAGQGTGNVVGLGYGSYLYVPQGYTSGTPLTTSATFSNVTLSQLFSSAQYTYTWGSGATFDTLTINVVAPVPEPSTWAAGLLTVAAIGYTQRKRIFGRRRSAAAV
jgi:hypothetical protein